MPKQTTSQPDNLNSQVLNLLRFPLAIVIVAVHIFAEAPAEKEAVCFPIFNVIQSFIYGFLHYPSVAIYFFISGFVFFLGLRTWDTDKWIKKIKNRKKTLLIPYLLWNLICFLLFVLYYRDFTRLNIKEFLSCFGSITTMPINYPLWFLKDLMIVVLFTPLLWKLLKKSGKLVLFSFAALMLLKNTGIIDFYVPAQALFFFSFGAYFSLNSKNMIADMSKVFKPSTIGYLILGFAAMYFYNTDKNIFITLKFPLIIFGLFFAFNLAAWLLKKGYCKVNEFLSSASFFMYVSHALVISTIFKVLVKIMCPVSDISWLIVYILNLVFTIALLLSTYYLMSKYLPKLLTLLTGKKS